MSYTCPGCGKGKVIPTAKLGRKAVNFDTKTGEKYEADIPPDFEIPTCTVCDEEWIDGKIAEALDGFVKAAHPNRS